VLHLLLQINRAGLSPSREVTLQTM
jgi:hypothetical protein